MSPRPAATPTLARMGPDISVAQPKPRNAPKTQKISS